MTLKQGLGRPEREHLLSRVSPYICNPLLLVTGETVHRCLGNSQLPGRYRGNTLLFETRPVLASCCAATDLLFAAETRLAEPLPRDSHTNLPAFRQHVTIFN
jgi:hypothetical protein